MTDAEKLRYEQEVEERVKERLNVKELKNIRYLLEQYNRENANDHENIRKDSELMKIDLAKLYGLKNDHELRITRTEKDIINQQKKNLWHYVIEFIKEKPWLAPAIIAASNVEHIINLIIKLLSK